MGQSTMILKAIACSGILLAGISNLSTDAFAMNKGELIDAIASNSGLSKADSKRALDAYVNSTTSALKKGDKIALVGFGTFSASRLPAPEPNPDGGLGKPIKVAFAGGKGIAGTLTRGEADTWELILGLPDGEWFEEPIALRAKMPRGFEPKFVDIEIGVAERSRDQLKTYFETGDIPTSAVQLTLPSNVFDPLPAVESGHNFLASEFGAFHPNTQIDVCEEALLSERLGYGGDAICDPAAGIPCAVDATVEQGVVDAIAVATALTDAEARAVLQVIRSLNFPPPDPAEEIESLSAMGSFSISARAARKGRNPQTGKSIKIAAKKVVKFKAGAELSSKVN